MGKLSLRDSITIILLIILTFAMSFGTAQYTAKQEIEKICDEKALQDLNYMLSYTDHELGQVEQAAKTFSAAVFEQDVVLPDSAKLYELEESFLQVNPFISSIMVGYEDRAFSRYSSEEKGYGVMVANTDQGLTRISLQPADYQDFEWYSIAIHKEKHRWCKPFVSPIAHRPITTYSFPIYNQNKHLIGVMGVNIPLSQLDSIMNNLKPYENAEYSVLLNYDLVYLMHPVKDLVLNMSLKDELESLGENVSDDFLAKLGARESGRENVTIDGRPKTIYYAPVKRAGCSVMLMLDDETMRQNIAPNVGLRVGVSVIGLLLTTLYLFMIVYRGKRRKTSS